MIAWLFACAGGDDTGPAFPGVYRVVVETDPDPPAAGAPTDVTLQVLGPDNAPVDDLVEIHERMVHSFVISKDLASFAHIHHEDFAALTGEDLRTATFHWPYTFPTSGDWFLAFEFANDGQYRSAGANLVVTGEPAQQMTPQIDTSGAVEVDGVRGELVWDVGPTASGTSEFHVVLTDVGLGEPVDDVGMWLGADAHVAVASEDLSVVKHTHAWVAGMDAMAPGHTMPHQYDGPELPFHVDFSKPGRWKLWVQFARAGAPDAPITLPLGFEIP